VEGLPEYLRDKLKVGKKIIHRLGITLLSLFVTFLFLKEEQPSLSSKVTW
jgi:hypothetical protein